MTLKLIPCPSSCSSCQGHQQPLCCQIQQKFSDCLLCPSLSPAGNHSSPSSCHSLVIEAPFGQGQFPGKDSAVSHYRPTPRPAGRPRASFLTGAGAVSTECLKLSRPQTKLTQSWPFDFPNASRFHRLVKFSSLPYRMSVPASSSSSVCLAFTQSAMS